MTMGKHASQGQTSWEPLVYIAYQYRPVIAYQLLRRRGYLSQSHQALSPPCNDPNHLNFEHLHSISIPSAPAYKHTPQFRHSRGWRLHLKSGSGIVSAAGENNRTPSMGLLLQKTQPGGAELRHQEQTISSYQVSPRGVEALVGRSQAPLHSTNRSQKLAVSPWS